MQLTETHPSAEPLLVIGLFASFADGEKSTVEREHIASLATELGGVDVSAISRRILMGRLSIDEAVAGLQSRDERMLAYEMARAVCEASGSISLEEETFLQELRAKLGIATEEAMAADAEVDALALAPLASSVDDKASAAVDPSGMILRYAILNGALELLPDTMATVAIIPMQMKMVWRIGKAHGYELDRSSIKEFTAAAGIGMGSQVVEGFARKLIGGFGKKLGGKMIGRVASEATGSAFSFAATYAIGQLAWKYYAGGRKLGVADLKAMYAPLLSEAKQVQTRYLPEIQQRAQGLDAASILNLVRGKTAV